MAYDPIRDATRMMFNRYRDAIAEAKPTVDEPQDETSLANLAFLCETALAEIETYPLDKLSRWLGFVQGVLTMRKIVTVQEERNFSRPIFHAAYKTAGIETPPTRNLRGN